MLYSMLKNGLLTLNQFGCRLQLDWRSSSSFNSFASLKSSIGFGAGFQILPITLQVFHFSSYVYRVCVKLRAQFFPSIGFLLRRFGICLFTFNSRLVFINQIQKQKLFFLCKVLTTIHFNSQLLSIKKINEF